jgi:predicted ATP-dependent endonuclease of OLD family
MKIRQLKIQNFKGYFEEQILNFAMPDGRKGSGLTVIVGPNNTGKTSTLEAMLVSENKRINEGDRHQGREMSIVKVDETGVEFVYKNIDNGSQIKQMNSNLSNNKKIDFEIVGAKKFWNDTTGNLNGLVLSGLSNTLSADLRKNQQTVDVFAHLITVNKDVKFKKELDFLLKKMIENFSSWVIETDSSSTDYLKYTANGVSHRSNNLGDGVLAIFRIAVHLLSNERDLPLIIDEPETSLHPHTQRKLSKILSEFSAKKQIIITTHSPYFMNWSDFENGSSVIRLNKYYDKKITISKLDSSAKYASFISANYTNYQKPQMLDIVAKEIFFSNRILFVEGQDDVGIIKKYLSDKNIDYDFDIFGYGVGGENNMKLFLQLAKDLGIHKVAAIYDGNSKEFTKDKLSFLEFKLLKTSHDDIRDKESKCKCNDEFQSDCCKKEKNKARDGIFDSGGEMKNGNEIAFANIITEVVKYFTVNIS